MAEQRARRGSLEVHLDYAFDRLRESKLAQAYDLLVPERERVVGARVKESGHEDGILIGDDTIVIRHCIPIGSTPPPHSGPATPDRVDNTPGGQSFLLRSGSIIAAAG